jgi:hypothetical protein
MADSRLIGAVTAAWPDCYTSCMEPTNISTPPRAPRPPVRIVRRRKRPRRTELRLRLTLRYVQRITEHLMMGFIVMLMCFLVGAMCLVMLGFVFAFLYQIGRALIHR